jgi:tetratricopeptide (TPR) repeat protein
VLKRTFRRARMRAIHRSLLLILLLGGTFGAVECITGLGTDDCHYWNHPTKAEIQEFMWYADAYNFLHGDEYYQPYYFGIPAYSQPPSAGNANYWLNEANGLYLAGSYEKASESYLEAVRLDPSLREGWLNMANSLYFLGRYQESLDAYNAVLKLEPQNANALRGKGQVLSSIDVERKANGAP